MPRLVAEKTDSLAADLDGDGVPSPGDEIAYTVTLKNLGNTAATGVQFVDLVPEHTALVAGSVASSAGAVDSLDPVEVSVGELPVGSEAVITFRVIDDKCPGCLICKRVCPMDAITGEKKQVHTIDQGLCIRGGRHQLIEDALQVAAVGGRQAQAA